MKIINTIQRNLFEDDAKTHEGHVYFFKLFELFIVLDAIKLAWEWGLYTLKIQDVVLPLGMAQYIDISFMHGNNLPLINAALISVLALVAYFRQGSRWQYFIVAILFHFQYVARFSIGEIPHSANLIGMSILAFGTGFIAFKDANQRIRFIMGIILFFTGLGYTTAAFSKLIGTGISWVDGRHLWLWMAEKGTDILSREGVFANNFLQNLAFQYIPVATLILINGLVTEFFGFLMWFKKTRPFATLFIIGMHVGITLTMNIRFDSFVIELIFIGFPWAALFFKYRDKLPLSESIQKIA